MAVESCVCTNPKGPSLGRPNCVIRKRKTAFIGVMFKNKLNGDANFIDATSATLGDDIRTLIQASTPADERLYLFPKMEEIDWARTDTAYKSYASGRRVKLDGEGGVRSFAGQIVGDDGVEAVARQIKATLGCTEVMAFDITVDGNIWGAMDDVASGELRGYYIEMDTFESYLMRAKDGESNGIAVSFDLEDDSDLINSYAITAGELGYRATTLRPLVAATTELVEASNTTIVATVTTDFGSAASANPVVGLLAANFSMTADGTPVTLVSVTEGADGEYTLTFADLDVPATADVVVSVTATGYDVADGTLAVS